MLKINFKFKSKFLEIKNYLNPFNGMTVINIQFRQTSNVKLIVYNVLGSEVVTLVNEYQHPGNYKVEFDGSNLSGELYYYKIKRGDFVDTKKMLLIK